MTKFEPEVKRRAHHGFCRYQHVLSADAKASGLATYGESLVDQFEATRKGDSVCGRAGCTVSLGAFSVGDQRFVQEAAFSAGTVIPFANLQPTVDSWKEVLGNPNSLKSMINSAAVALGTTVPVLILGTPAAYGLARYEFVIGSEQIALWFLSQRVFLWWWFWSASMDECQESSQIWKCRGTIE